VASPAHLARGGAVPASGRTGNDAALGIPTHTKATNAKTSMRFLETYRRFAGARPVFSFEVFPPRTAAAEEGFHKVVPELVALRPHFITVTYGAMGSTRDRTLEIASAIKRDHGIETACHLTCVGSTPAEIDALLDRIRAAGIQNLVALRGDPPQGEKEFRPPPGGYAHAIQLVEHIRRRGEFGIAVAGYPEKHIEAPSWESDLQHLKEKVDAGGDLVITQLFYDNRLFFDFATRARAAGIRCPIVPGILPILNGKQVRRITRLCGATIPAALLAELDAAGDDAPASEAIGIRQAVRQVQELLDNGVPGVHFYVLNRASHMQKIFGALGVA
jgi:methylenetetrahydrofolate reductase (NADPH)